MYNRGCSSVQKMYYSPEKKHPIHGQSLLALCEFLSVCQQFLSTCARSSRWFPPPGTSWSQRPPTPYCATMCSAQASKGPDHRHARTHTHVNTPWFRCAAPVVYEQLLKLPDGVGLDWIYTSCQTDSYPQQGTDCSTRECCSVCTL